MLCNLFPNISLRGVKHLSPGVRRIPLFNLFSSSEIHKRDSELKKQQKATIERTITVKDVEMFSKLTGDFNTVHLSCNNENGIVHGAFLNGLVSGVIGTKLPGHGTIVISQTLRFPNPCYVGETVEISVEIQDLRKIITCNYQVVKKPGGAIVLEGNAKLLFKNTKE